MTEPRLKKFRHAAAARQHFRCYYCEFPMWESDPQAFAARHGISAREARHFMCTAEHLHPLGEGGTSQATNIVAACQRCNSLRHRRKKRISPETFAAHVARRLARHAWVPGHLYKLVSSTNLFPLPQ